MNSIDQTVRADAATPVKPVETPPKPTEWRPPGATLATILLAAALAGGGMLAVLSAWRLPPFATAVVGTDNAYVRGRTTIVSPQVSGYIAEIPVHDYQSVAAGATLVRIDDRTYRQQVAAAQASLDLARANLENNKQTIAQRQLDIATAEAKIASADAQLVKATADKQRADELVRQGSMSQSQLDTATAALDTTKAAVREALANRDGAGQALKSAEVNNAALSALVESATAQLELARIDLGYTEVKAPEGGTLSDVGARTGQYVTNGTELMFLVPDAHWVIANLKEADTADVRPGQRAWFTVDALGGARFEGRVDRISPAAGSEFSVLRTDNAIGNFTKIPQRIPVKIVIDPGQPSIDRLRPGMSVEAYVDTDS
ncbi:multidrug resistance efflux pump [Rhizobium subbaraonis]|uniref:Multidrug resistance efflux pump n=1 Tax=Rhizobium subbaraonis TaxID=908946 RepID=A0A285U4E1_9HYPH|nr:HlyD family secretion protein [Rhizobium subbaraonis]SOC36775.1 multidrug resistance efflux pump [Rhizobium subbaraonis]